MFELIKIENYFIKAKINEHDIIKPILLEQIESMGTHSLIEKEQQISNSDYHLSDYYTRNYFHVFNNTVVAKHLIDLKNILLLGSSSNLIMNHYWFQQYKNNDFHSYHLHGTCFYSSVYYLELPEKSSKTTFKILDKEFDIDVEEGDILTFPSSYLHCSKPNKSDFTKTIIGFDIICD